jgi:23S rRNA G2445 N2-methylase RlmL
LVETKNWDWYVITNPPYGKRMNSDDLEWLYKDLVEIYNNGAKWCFITSWPNITDIVSNEFKVKQLNNNWEEAQIYLKK